MHIEGERRKKREGERESNQAQSQSEETCEPPTRAVNHAQWFFRVEIYRRCESLEYCLFRHPHYPVDPV